MDEFSKAMCRTEYPQASTAVKRLVNLIDRVVIWDVTVGVVQRYMGRVCCRQLQFQEWSSDVQP
jgi:hypothetical protein